MEHDLRAKNRIYSNNRIYEADVVGVKCASKNFRYCRSTLIMTRSYDDHVRFLDLIVMGDIIYPGNNILAMKLFKVNLDDGVWWFSVLL